MCWGVAGRTGGGCLASYSDTRARLRRGRGVVAGGASVHTNNNNHNQQHPIIHTNKIYNQQHNPHTLARVHTLLINPTPLFTDATIINNNTTPTRSCPHSTHQSQPRPHARSCAHSPHQSHPRHAPVITDAEGRVGVEELAHQVGGVGVQAAGEGEVLGGVQDLLEDLVLLLVLGWGSLGWW